MYTHRDDNIPHYEHENDNLFPLVEYKSSDPQRGMCFVRLRGLNVAECEIARVLKVAASSIEAVAFIVPRKVCSRAPAPLSHILIVLLQSDSFQSDISLCAVCRACSVRGRVLQRGNRHRQSSSCRRSRQHPHRPQPQRP